MFQFCNTIFTRADNETFRNEHRDQTVDRLTNICRQIFEFWRKLKEYLRNLNFFQSIPPSTDEHDLFNQRISTRLFIIIFSIAFTILLLYNSLITVTKSITVEEPSFLQYAHLNSTYPQTIICPCSNISINYENLVRVDYTLHQVCNSIFVDQSWFEYLRKTFHTNVGGNDFRWTSPYAFQALKIFCDLINRTINDNLITFNSSKYVSASVIAEHVFESEAKSLIDQFRSSMTNTFSLSLSIIQGTTEANALLSGLQTNFYLYQANNSEYLTINGTLYDDCRCVSSSKCISSSSIYNDSTSTPIFTVPYFYRGCYVIESLLQSTLECFYDQECIDQLQSFISGSSSINVTALNASLSSRYSVNSSIKDLVDKLMIEQWDVSPLYERYYNECRPTQCTYKLETNNDIIYIITTLFGVAGGLTTILKIIIPRLIKLIRKKRGQQQHPAIEMGMREQIRRLVLKSIHNLVTLNLFPSVPPSTDEHDLRNQRLSTRLFIFLLILLMTILLLYTSLITVAKTITKEEPSFAQYVHINSTYSSTLTCPCSEISINQKKFVRVNYTLHQVCNSIFVNQSWIDYLTPPIGTPIFATDSWTIASAFQTLRILCDLINDTISDSLVQFNSNQYVSASTVPQQQLELEIQSFVDKFRSSITNSFSLSYLMIRETTQANDLFSALFTNRAAFIDKDTNQMITSSFLYDNCMCSSSSTCTSPLYISKYSIDKPISFHVRGFYMGCYVIEALLQSTLQCFYDQECIDQLQSFIFWSSLINVTALNAPLSNMYSINSTIKDLVDNLMIEEWNVSITYETYYNECRPTQCTYKLETSNDIIYIITTLFGIAGGLITILEVVVPRLVKFVRKKTQQQQQPTTIINNQRSATVLLQKLKDYLLNLNFFPSVPPSTDEQDLRNQRISTRLFIFLLILLMTILLLYTSLITMAKTITKEEPSFAQYVHLNSTYSSTLTCPCSKISINQKKFVRVNYTLHQVCNSTFVNQSWIDYLAVPNGIEFYVWDFRWFNRYTFPTLKTLCDVMNSTIFNSLIGFYSNKYVSASVNPQQLFERQIEILVDQLRSSMKNTFSLSLSLIRNMTQANALFSALRTNYYPELAADKIHVYMRRAFYDECECVISSKCINPSSIYGDSVMKPVFNVSGFYKGCYVIEALLQSTLECFYDQECIDQLQSFIFWSPSIKVTALNASLSNMYSINSTIKDLVDNLMIEEWNVSITYETYYNECRPTQCTYKLERRNDIIYIVTTLFGIAGGLITVLEVVVPRLVKLIVYCIRQRGARVMPETFAIQT